MRLGAFFTDIRYLCWFGILSVGGYLLCTRLLSPGVINPASVIFCGVMAMLFATICHLNAKKQREIEQRSLTLLSDVIDGIRHEDAMREVHSVRANLINSIAFQFRTPLTSIRGFSKMLANEQGALPLAQRECIQFIYDGSLKLQELLDSLLPATGVPYLTSTDSAERRTLRETVDRLNSLMRPLMDSHGLVVLITCEIEVANIVWPHGRLTSFILHLLLYITQQGMPKGRVEINVSRADVTSIDRGIRISFTWEGAVIETDQARRTLNVLRQITILPEGPTSSSSEPPNSGAMTDSIEGGRRADGLCELLYIATPLVSGEETSWQQ